MLNFNKSILIISLFFILLIIFPIFIAGNDFWDGTIIEYASISNNFEGIEIYFFESRWILQYYLSKLIINLSNFLNLGYTNLNAIFLYIVFLFFLSENLYLSKNMFNLDKRSQNWYLILLVTFPGFSVLSSSIMTFHLFCFTLTLFAVRIIHTNLNKYKHVFGFFFIFLSFGFKPLLVFSPMLSICYDYSNKQKYYFSYRTIIILLLSVISFLLRLISPPYGNYEGHNPIIFFQKDAFYNLFYGIYYYLTYPAITLFVSFLLIAGLILFKYKLIFKKYLFKNLVHILIPIFILFICSSFPYIAVGKWAAFWDIKHWTHRYALLISVPFSLFSIIFINNIFNFVQISLGKKNKIINFIFIIFLTINLTFFSSSIIERLNKKIFENNFIYSLKNYFQSPIEPGYVQLISSTHPDAPNFKLVEVNFLLYKTFNQRSYYSNFFGKKNNEFKVNKFMLSNDKYQHKYIFSKNLKCTNYIYLKSDGYLKLFDKIKNILRIQSPKVIIQNYELNCN